MPQKLKHWIYQAGLARINPAARLLRDVQRDVPSDVRGDAPRDVSAMLPYGTFKIGGVRVFGGCLEGCVEACLGGCLEGCLAVARVCLAESLLWPGSVWLNPCFGPGLFGRGPGLFG
jgi:hypothetical protein